MNQSKNISDQGIPVDSTGISATEPDWTRETPKGFWDPGRRLLRCIRRYQALRGKTGPIALLRRKYWTAQHLFWSTITQCEIQLETEIGGGLRMQHPTGIIIHPDAVIGPNCMIFNHVTIGVGKGGKVPVLGGHVDIAAGARLIGGITVGDHAVIGLNTVVLRDIPAHGVAVGVPARIIRIGRNAPRLDD
jgi:serine O-acetyltransferase